MPMQIKPGLNTQYYEYIDSIRHNRYNYSMLQMAEEYANRLEDLMDDGVPISEEELLGIKTEVENTFFSSKQPVIGNKDIMREVSGNILREYWKYYDIVFK